jgi:hypothetical protein
VSFVLLQPSPADLLYFTDENLYAGSNDVEFIGQALW